MKTRRMLICCSIVVAAIIGVSILAPIICVYDPNAADIRMHNQPISWAHLLGTDSLGRDVLTRTLYGGRAALAITTFATVTIIVTGIIFGAIAAWFDGWIDTAIQVLMNIFQGLPGLSISIAVVGVLGPSSTSLYAALVLSGWSSLARVVRGQIRSLKDEAFVDFARIYRSNPLSIIIRHLLPIALPTLVVLAANRWGRMILALASLSFIGVGLQPPTPDWGVMIQDGRQYFAQQPWAVIAPALLIFLFSFAVARIGELLRDHWDIYRPDALEV